jgi:type 1 fimbria pilin
MKTIVLRGLFLMLANLAVTQAAFAQLTNCNAHQLNAGNAGEAGMGDHTLSTSQYDQWGQWVAVGGWKMLTVALAGPDCTAGGLINEVTITRGSNIILSSSPLGTTIPIYKFTSAGNNSDVGYVLQYRTPMDGGRWQDPSTAPRNKFYGHTYRDLTIEFRYHLVVKLPAAAPMNSQTLIDNANTPAQSVFNPMTINLSGAPVRIYPVRVTVGKVVLQSPTCAFTTATLNQTVAFPDFALSDFTGIGHETPPKDFDLETTNCNTVAARQGFMIEFTTDGVVTDPNYFPTSIAPLGLGLIALDSTSGPSVNVKPNDTLNFSAQEVAGRYRFRAYLRQLQSTVPAGGVNAAVKLTINYR